MKLYDYYRSTACYRVRIALAMKQIDYAKLPIHLINNGGEQHSDLYRQLNPQGLVPTLDDEKGHILYQSLAIIEYLNEIYPKPGLLPSTAVSRAQVRSLCLMIACDIHPLNNLRVLKRLRHQFHADEASVTNWYFHWLKEGFDAFEHQLKYISNKHSYCYGSKPTMADLCLIPQVYNAKRFGFSLEPYPLITAINEHCLTHPAFQEAMPSEK